MSSGSYAGVRAYESKFGHEAFAPFASLTIASLTNKKIGLGDYDLPPQHVCDDS